jgi:hypothetical protein
LRSLPRLVAACCILLFGVCPVEAQAQSLTVSGQVVESEHRVGLVGATVRLSGHSPYISDPDGSFRFTRVRPGSHTLTVEAMGYGYRQLLLTVREDTTVVVEVDVDPILLDSLIVELGTITLRGRVTDGNTGRPVSEAWINTGRAPEAYTYSDGSFRIKDLPRGQAIPILVEAYRYLPARSSVISQHDTSLAIALEPDSLGIRLFSDAVGHLELRSRAVNLSAISLGRDYIERRARTPLYDMIRSRIGRNFRPSCLFIDEKRITEFGILDSYRAAEIERIEVYGRGLMVRIYTQEFVARNLTKVQELPSVVYARRICF